MWSSKFLVFVFAFSLVSDDVVEQIPLSPVRDSKRILSLFEIGSHAKTGIRVLETVAYGDLFGIINTIGRYVNSQSVSSSFGRGDFRW
jgi:hypothetical protein